MYIIRYPSLLGPDNLPPLEAFGCKCPVIAAGIPGASEQLGSAALLFDPLNSEDLSKKIMRLRADNKLRSKLVAAGTAIASIRTPEAYLTEVCAMLDEFEPIRRCWGRSYHQAKL